MYAELHCCSNFTFLEGGSHPEELVERALEAGLHAIALTDRDGLYGMVRFSKAAAARGVPGIVGTDLSLSGGETITLLAEDAAGYANLCEAISRAQLHGYKGHAHLDLERLNGRSGELVALTQSLDAKRVEALHAIFEDRLYLELQHHLHAQDAQHCRRLLELARRFDIPYVATNGAYYARKEDARVADVLYCIKEKTSLATAREENRLRPNAEYYLKTPRMMAQIFAGYPQAIRNTLAIAERCTFRLDRLEGQFPLFPVPRGQTRQSFLRAQVYAGAAQRYGDPLDAKVERQLEYELGMIAKMDLAGYFLIVWDIVREAGRLGVLCQGRGSAANSAVCYALGITAVDPVGMDLLFERFMSEGRKEIPDIDVDFAHQDREKVIQYVYERYGRTHAAMAAETITFRTRSALRDVGKAVGLSVAQVDALAREYDARESLPDALDASRHAEPTTCHPEPTACHPEPTACHPEPVEGPRAQRGDLSAKILELCRRIEGFPRHMGIHSGGMVITRDPLVRVAPVEWATMRDRTIVQWDKDDLQDLGLIKIDLLGLGMLSLLREAFALHKRYCDTVQSVQLGRTPSSGGVGLFSPRQDGDGRGGTPQLHLHTIPQNDGKTYEMMQRADTIGVFQIESRAQQSMLPRMKPACFYDIVMQVAIIRPGPIQGQMIHPFLRRRSGLEPVTYPHPKLKPVLERTLGVPLFQEQGMRMAIEAAGFSPSQADELRRAMGHKRSRARMLQIYPRLIAGMVENGIDREAAEQLFHMLEGFADYGFPESHAASFALLAYASAYVKCHYPAIFGAAILNVQPMGFYSTEVLVNDARRHGVSIEPVTVNRSEYWSFVDPRGALQLGFHLIRGLGEAQRSRLESAVAQGPFADLREFALRTQLEKEALENLAVAGAFSPWFASRREAMWALRGLDERETRGELGRLMDLAEPAAPLRAISARQETAFDLWSTGVSPQRQPMEHLREALQRRGVTPACDLPKLPNNRRCTVGGLVITRQRPGTAKGFVFLTLEDETGLVNVIVRPDVYERYKRAVRQAMTVIIEGVLQKESGCIDVLAKTIRAFNAADVTGPLKSRNFQ